jgi:hypothetical protein
MLLAFRLLGLLLARGLVYDGPSQGVEVAGALT